MLCPCHFTSGNDPVPTVKDLGGPQRQPGWVWKILPPLGFDDQPVEYEHLLVGPIPVFFIMDLSEK